MTKQRVMTAGGIAVFVIAVLLLSGIPWVLPVVAALLSFMATFELMCITKINCSKVWGWSYLILSVAVPLLPVPHYTQILSLLFTVTILAFVWFMGHMEKVKPDHPVMMLFLVLVVSFFFKAMVQLRSMEHGFANLVMAVLVCVMTDSGAYFVGRRFGKHKMAPKISPKKTMEGCVGGAVMAVLLMILLGWAMELWGNVSVSFAKLALWAVTATAVAQFGDLSISVIKRVCGVKDFSNLFPGHGGILDRFDSSLFVIPFTLVFLNLWGGWIG